MASSVPTDTPEAMLAGVRSYRARGYRVHSVKIGSGVAEDVARIEALAADEQPGETIFYDVNRAWLPHVAITVMNAVRDLPVWFEQPCETLEECATVRATTTHPISLDEAIVTSQDLLRARDLKAGEIVNIKIGRVGGLTRARRLRDVALDCGMGILVEDTGGTILADTAAAHLASTVPEHALIGTWSCQELITVDPAPGQGARVVDGTMRAPDVPGLGVEIDADALGTPAARYVGPDRIRPRGGRDVNGPSGAPSTDDEAGAGRMSANQRNVSVGKAAALLRAAARYPDGASVSQLARATRIPRATALRMIVALESEYLLTRIADDDRVLLGTGILELAAAVRPERILIEAAREPMRRARRRDPGDRHARGAPRRRDRRPGRDTRDAPHRAGHLGRPLVAPPRHRQRPPRDRPRAGRRRRRVDRRARGRAGVDRRRDPATRARRRLRHGQRPVVPVRRQGPHRRRRAPARRRCRDRPAHHVEQTRAAPAKRIQQP